MTFSEWLWERALQTLDWFSKRRENWLKRLMSSRCAKCGERAYPICDQCQAERHHRSEP